MRLITDIIPVPQERTMSEESGELLPLGKLASLLTKDGVRYEGKLYTVASFHLTAH